MREASRDVTHSQWQGETTQRSLLGFGNTASCTGRFILKCNKVFRQSVPYSMGAVAEVLTSA
jgi:hypothetical protein